MKSSRQSCTLKSLKLGFQGFSTLIFSSYRSLLSEHEERTTTLYRRSNKHVKNLSLIPIISLEKNQHGSKRHCEGTLERSLCLEGRKEYRIVCGGDFGRPGDVCRGCCQCCRHRRKRSSPQLMNSTSGQDISSQMEYVVM
uniref:Uncharacterized protein LOC111110259 n=1 Tax=Crassostrea virginica TaxID=6565 RepID=A0A8B8BG98_CRAVI|nr:uncharacterized protein LOC111110259 [Crassostrea virginica]